MTRKNGGPAFPRPESEHMHPDSLNEGHYMEEAQTGMTLRDYFATHAPAQPTWNFEPVMNTPRPVPQMVEGDHDSAECVNKDEIESWNNERNKQWSIQWPWVWADAMLAQSGK